MKDSWLDSWLPVLTGLIGIIGTTIANRFDFRGIVRKGELENKKLRLKIKMMSMLVGRNSTTRNFRRTRN